VEVVKINQKKDFDDYHDRKIEKRPTTILLLAINLAGSIPTNWLMYKNFRRKCK
jgi:hypothetical protein